MADTLSREEELFDAARMLKDPAQREEFLERACDGDPDLRQRVATLLSVHIHAEELFTECISAMRTSADVPESSAAARDLARGVEEEQPGAQIGPYKILQKLGEGGGGAVYMAQQEKPMRRLVALKVIKLGMDTRAVIARFDAERQALAMMDHPNIAKVLDAGATRTGRPYFVMELVRGIRITEYCDQNRLDTGRRLELFIQTCHAIQHAHQKGIIHRDIKPSNIIVTVHDGLPVPKVIDFGIAKATEAPLTDKTFVTMQNQFIGTPAYMSPEQAGTGGLDIDTRSDIYSLGVLLYELLTGKTPFDPKALIESGMDEMRKTLREEEPPRPSALLTVLAGKDLATTAARHQTELPRLIALIRGDLDWIVMKALEKERARRYETANGLAMDIRRHLSSEPVLARPPSRLYRLQKLVRRNKVVFVAAAAVSSALLAGLGTSTWLFLKEKEALQRAVEAERQQARLTEETELARSNEAKLRRQAESREKITQAAILVSQGRFDEADSMISRESPTEPSVEGAALLRSLSQWHALQDRWTRAVDRFGLLLQANQLEGWDQSTLDFLGCGVSLVEGGGADHYDGFRQSALSRFASTTNAVAAERIVKISLLESPSKSVVESLAPLAGVAEEFFATAASSDAEADFRAAWGSVSLALWEYRRGHYTKSIEWARRSLACPEPNAPRAATAHLELALALWQTTRKEEALRELSQGRQSIEDKFKEILEPGSAKDGFWFDWVFARILLREAVDLIDPPSSLSS
jgi:eukaryotic-like serine/threonine-protein kinase